jgi:hypothetical protein
MLFKDRADNFDVIEYGHNMIFLIQTIFGLEYLSFLPLQKGVL